MLAIITAVIGAVFHVLVSAWEVYLLLSPYFIFGLAFAGVLYVLISQRTVIRLMGREGLASVTTAAAFGLPLPICSCGVIPITATLRKKGASRSACMSFLITTPETGMDSILVTWGLMGPIMAIIRPVGAFFSALLAGICSIAMIRGPDPVPKGTEKEQDHHHHHHHDHDHSHDFEEDPAVVGVGGLMTSIKASSSRMWNKFINWTHIAEWNRPMLDRSALALPLREVQDAVPLSRVGKRMFTFAFIEMADDILFALVVGVVLSGVVMVLVPDNIAEYGLYGWRMYLVMLVAGVPLYMCASASTPIAAALVAKGFSPGSALVFLMTGPATNTATIIVLMQQFGLRFVSIYIGSIVFGAVVCGIALDLMLIYLGWEIALNLEGRGSGFVGFLEWTGATLLTILIAWRFWKGAAASGYHDLMGNINSTVLQVSGLAKGARMREIFSLRSKLVQIGVPLVLGVYLATGLTAIPVGYLGYGKLFGEVRWPALAPGLHYAPPPPFGTIDIHPHTVQHRIIVGLKENLNVEETTVSIIQDGAANKPRRTQWHRKGDLRSQKTSLAEFLSGDESLLRILISVHYSIANPYMFYYEYENREDSIAHHIQAIAREYIATNELSDLLSKKRAEIEHFMFHELILHLKISNQVRHDSQHTEDHDISFQDDQGTIGGEQQMQDDLRLLSVNVVDIHPVPETIPAFRDVTDASQDRTTSILEAERSFTLLVPRAVGNADVKLRRNVALADGRVMKAQAEQQAFIAKAESVSEAPSILQDLLWYETVESAYNNRQTFIVPEQKTPQNLTLWRRVSNLFGRSEHDVETDKSEHE
ncbi:MAG: SO_0444 family Cu/Zn efflux transporter [Acidiferrobacterales bacterium]|nr:SO_0444 family Cu/Zn efflux transporter [Acidiferrobacterales bacterium]